MTTFQKAINGKDYEAYRAGDDELLGYLGRRGKTFILEELYEPMSAAELREIADFIERQAQHPNEG